MQKVEGSSPFIRSSKAPLDGAFCCLEQKRGAVLESVQRNTRLVVPEILDVEPLDPAPTNELRVDES
jgi:hypothetical protein